MAVAALFMAILTYAYLTSPCAILPQDPDPFCREAMVSLTSHFNEGALSCDCNTEGSDGDECKPIGGQCSCLPNVIGRQCTRCKPDFFGYPNCKQCSCPPTAR